MRATMAPRNGEAAMKMGIRAQAVLFAMSIFMVAIGTSGAVILFSILLKEWHAEWGWLVVLFVVFSFVVRELYRERLAYLRRRDAHT